MPLIGSDGRRRNIVSFSMPLKNDDCTSSEGCVQVRDAFKGIPVCCVRYLHTKSIEESQAHGSTHSAASRAQGVHVSGGHGGWHVSVAPPVPARRSGSECRTRWSIRTTNKSAARVGPLEHKRDLHCVMRFGRAVCISSGG